MDWWNLMKQSVTVGAQLLWSVRYGCNNGRYGCTIVMSYIEINKAVSQWLLTFNLCVSVTWPLTCAFHIPCTHTPEIIDMHRGVCDKDWIRAGLYGVRDSHLRHRTIFFAPYGIHWSFNACMHKFPWPIEIESIKTTSMEDVSTWLL